MELLAEPVLIVIFPRWSTAVEVVRRIAVEWSGPRFAVALPERDDQASLFRRSWKDDSLPLLMVRCFDGNSQTVGVEVVSSLSRQNQGRPLGILLADGPELSGYREERRHVWNRDFARQASIAIQDVQVFEYVSTWSTNPPRIR